MNDVRFALRILARNPGSTALIIALLALGTGASTTMFSLFDAVLLRPLPVRHPEQLVQMVQRLPKPLGLRSEFPYGYYKALRERSKTLGPIFAEAEWHDHFRLTDPEPAEEITVYGVTPEFFAALGSRPLLGRFPAINDAARDTDMPPAVLSYNFWRRRLGGNGGSIEGRTLAINGHRFSIAGVMPHGLHGLSVDSGPDIRIPLQAFSLLTPEFDADHTEFALAGRLQPGVTPAQAQVECLTIWRRVMQDYYQNIEKVPRESIPGLLRRGMEVRSLERGTSILRDNFGDVFQLLMASVSVLLVIVALNVAGLLLARAAVRQREMAVRLAIGGSPWRIARQLLVESILLSAVGAAGGLMLSLIMMPLAIRSLPPVRDMYTAIMPISLRRRPQLACLFVSPGVIGGNDDHFYCQPGSSDSTFKYLPCASHGAIERQFSRTPDFDCSANCIMYLPAGGRGFAGAQFRAAARYAFGIRSRFHRDVQVRYRDIQISAGSGGCSA